MKTIKQIADELGVSKDRVKYQVGKLPGENRVKVGKITHITNAGVATLYSVLSGEKVGNYPGKNRVKVGNLPTDLPTDDSAFYQEQIKAMQATIADLTAANRELTAALEHTTASLHAAQALHAGTMQKQLTDGAEAKPNWIKRLFQRGSE